MNDMLNIYVMMSQFIEIYIKKKRELDITDLGRKLYDPFYSICYLYLIQHKVDWVFWHKRTKTLRYH